MTKSQLAQARKESCIPADAPPRITNIDPELLPERYAMVVDGDCMEPEIMDGTVCLFDRTLPARNGDLALIFLRPECVQPGRHQGAIKRLVMAPPSWVTLPYVEHPNSEIEPLIIAEMLNPARQFMVKCSSVLAIHRCLGPCPDTVKTHYQPYDELERKTSRRRRRTSSISVR